MVVGIGDAGTPAGKDMNTAGVSVGVNLGAVFAGMGVACGAITDGAAVIGGTLTVGRAGTFWTAEATGVADVMGTASERATGTGVDARGGVI